MVGDTDPLLPLLSPSATPRRKAPLLPLPEHGELSLPHNTGSTSSLKDFLIFGPASPHDTAPPEDKDNNSWNYFTPLEDPPPAEGLHRWKSNLHRSSTAPAMAAINDLPSKGKAAAAGSAASSGSIISQAFILLLIYLALGVAIYTLNRHHFAGMETYPVVDALYFCIVTMCTIGYGDITPDSAAAKLFSIAFVLVGFGFIDILMSAMVSYVLDLQESLLLTAVTNDSPARGAAAAAAAKGGSSHHRHEIARHYIVDVKKGRMRIRMKVALALGVVLVCVGVGTAVLCFVEKLGCLDAFYLSVMSVTTVGYGDRAFKTMGGRLFASVWLLVSTLAVARAFLYLAEARIDKRHRKIAKWVLSRDMTVSEFLKADIDHNGYVSKSEFVVYKLKEMGKVSEKDIMLICNQFNKIDSGNLGKITLSDLIESHH